MKFGEQEYLFDREKVTKVWIALNQEQILCDNKEIAVKVKSLQNPKSSQFKMFIAENKIRCALERIEDGIEYLNKLVLVPDYSKRNAFDFIEFINCEYVIVHCVESLADIFGTNIDNIVSVSDCFIKLEYGNGNDKEVFEYIRSLCAVHPLETSFHPSVHGAENFDCCSRLIWDKGFYDDERNLSAVIYSSNRGNDIFTLGLTVEAFVKYLNKWIDLLDEISKSIGGFIKSEEERYRNIKIMEPEQFGNYVEYIDNLKKEYERRVGCSHIEYFDKYKLAFLIDFDNQDNQKKKECYKSSIIYMFEYLHKQLQGMRERENTGIVNLADNEYTTLFLELCYPIAVGSDFSNDMGAFAYVDNLKSSVAYDVSYARHVLDHIKPIVNEYVVFNNDESPEETDLLLQIATYFDALQYDGYISRSIPNEKKFRDASAL